MSGEIERARERYEQAAGAMWSNLAGLIPGEVAMPGGYRFLSRRVAVRLAEEQDRREWIADVKRRYGIVTIGERSLPYRLEWPVDVPDGNWRVISDHRLEVPLTWPSECRCVLLDGEQVSLGGSCPVHSVQP